MPHADATDTQLKQTVLKAADETIVFWSFVQKKKEFQLLLRLRVERQDDDEEIRISVESIGEEGLDSRCLPVPPPSSARAFRLLLSDGMILLRPLPLGCTSFTFIAQVDVQEVEYFDPGEVTGTLARAVASTKAGLTSTTKAVMGGAAGASSKTRTGTKKYPRGVKADDALCKVVDMFYERFEKEEVIDARMKADFKENKIPNAPPLTEDEKKLIAESLKLVEELKAERVAGTVNDSVEKVRGREERSDELGIW